MKGRINKLSVSNTLPLIGRIKVGMKVVNENGKEYPTSLDYFRATGKYADIFDKHFGEKCSRIGIVFITDDVTEACNQYYAAWDKGKLWGKAEWDDSYRAQQERMRASAGRFRARRVLWT